MKNSLFFVVLLVSVGAQTFDPYLFDSWTQVGTTNVVTFSPQGSVTGVINGINLLGDFSTVTSKNPAWIDIRTLNGHVIPGIYSPTTLADGRKGLYLAIPTNSTTIASDQAARPKNLNRALTLVGNGSPSTGTTDTTGTTSTRGKTTGTTGKTTGTTGKTTGTTGKTTGTTGKTTGTTATSGTTGRLSTGTTDGCPPVPTCNQCEDGCYSTCLQVAIPKQSDCWYKCIVPLCKNSCKSSSGCSASMTCGSCQSACQKTCKSMGAQKTACTNECLAVQCSWYCE